MDQDLREIDSLPPFVQPITNLLLVHQRRHFISRDIDTEESDLEEPPAPPTLSL
jgi:hypothetical protein